MTATDTETGTLGLHAIENYAPLIGPEATERILRKAKRVRDLHVVHISSTFYGGGVTEILTPLCLSRLVEDWIDLLAALDWHVPAAPH
jgi:trehalose synthase